MRWCEHADKYSSAFHQVTPASLCASYGCIEAGGISNSVAMLQAVKGNEGRYFGLLLHNHPKTHRRINEEAGGRLISSFCVTVGAHGVGHSGLKAAPTPLATWQHSRATPSLLDLSQVCPAWAPSVTAEAEGTFIHKNNKPVIIHLKPGGQFQWLWHMLQDPLPLVGVQKNTCCDVLLRQSVHISILYNRITDAGNTQSERYLRELCILSTKAMQHINMLTNIEFSQASLLQI